MDISGILGQVRAGGFTNPLSGPITAAINKVTIPSLSELTVLANAQALINGGLVPTEAKLQNALNSVTNAFNKTQDLLHHTDKISGVNLSGTGSLATIAKTMQSAKSINGEKSCSTVLAAFGSIQNAATLISDTINTINQIDAFIKDIPHQVDIIIASTAAYINRIEEQIVSDVGALAQAQIAVLENTVAQSMVSLFQDECTSQVLAAVMTQPMKNEVTQVTAAIKAKKLTSIIGLTK